MAIQFSCPHCGVSTQVGDQFAGQTGPCRQCGQAVTVPIPKGQAPAPAQGSTGGSSTGNVLLVVALIAVVSLVLCGGVGVALLLPAVQAAREAARRSQCANNLKQIALALHNYHDVNKSFPPAYTVDENGRPLHSWRTLILPYLEQQHLYSQIALDEPWDSPRNQQFHNVSLPFFQCPSQANNTGPDCHYVALVGPQSTFPGNSAVSLADITDGSSNTLLVVETTGTGKSWMAPIDLDVTTTPLVPGVGATSAGSRHPGGFQAAFADGSVRFIANSTAPQQLQHMTTRNGGELIQ